MTKNKVVFISETKNDILSQIDIIQKYQQKSDCDILIVSIGYESQLICKKYNLLFKTTLDYLTTDRHYRSCVDSCKFANGWWKKSEVEKTLNHKYISLCEIMKYDFYTLFSGFFLDIELYMGIIDNEKPDKIIMTKNLQFEQNNEIMKDDCFIVESLSNKNRIDIEWVTPIETNKKNLIQKNRFKLFINFIKDKKQLAYLVGWHTEIIRNCRIIWHYYFSILFRHRILKTFSQKKRKIIFAGGTRSAINLADHLKDDTKNGLVCLKLPGKKWPKSILPIADIEFFSTPKIDEIVDEKRKSFIEVLDNNKILNYFKKEFCYNGLYFWPVMKKKLEYLLGEYLPLLVKSMELIKEMNKRVDIDILLSTSDQNPIINAMTKMLQSEKKKTLVYLHGADYCNAELTKIFFSKMKIPIFADKIATWGDAARDWFIDQGVLPNRVNSTSCSEFDEYSKILSYSKDRIYKILGISSKKIILYTLEHANRDSMRPYRGATNDEIIQHLKDVIEEIKKLSDVYLIVRPHPGDLNKERIEQIICNTRNKNIIFNPKLPLPYLLRITDILITCHSATALESMIFGSNVIIYNRTGRPEVIPYVDDGVAVRVEKKEDLIPTISEIFKNEKLIYGTAKKREEFVKYCAGSIDGNASQNIANLIYQMIEK